MQTSIPASKWTDEQLDSDAVTKKMLVQFLQDNASSEFLENFRMIGKLDSVAKTKSKPDLISHYKELFSKKSFRNPEDEAKHEAAKKAAAEQAAASAKPMEKQEEKKEDKKEEVKYKKEVLKKGDGSTYPRKGDAVTVRYKGMLTNGTVFDTNMDKKGQPLKFTVGVGKVIRGWDHGLLTMSVGEQAKLTIEPSWAYGKNGKEGVIPPNSTLIFEVELLAVS